MTLTWRRTWPDNPEAEDWTVKEGRDYCRVYRTIDGRYYWCAARGKNLGSGLEAARDEAMARAEEVWER